MGTIVIELSFLLYKACGISEIQETIREYQLTQFGGWPWPKTDYTHVHTSGRFAKYANGKIETR